MRFLRLKHLRHPLRTARLAMTRIAAQVQMRTFAAHCERHFRGDPRYDLNNVTAGFTPRFDVGSDDAALLQRICDAYSRTVSHPDSALACYQPTGWWKALRENNLKPVMQALAQSDIAKLRTMYGNFFRDPCATGLVGVPYGMANAYFHRGMRDGHRRAYMGDALYRIDYWISQTGGHFGLLDLAGPAVGNPFGISVQGTLVRPGSEYQHYCAHKILRRLDGAPSVVGEIGGGYGGMAYYLLRDGGPLTYVNFDVPESLALSSYYLMKAFPSLRFLLYGEREPTVEALAASDIVLLPLFQMDKMPAGSLNLTFSSHTLADLSDLAITEYLPLISRMTSANLICFGDSRAVRKLSRWGGGRLRLVEGRSSGWNLHKTRQANEGEYVYDLCRN